MLTDRGEVRRGPAMGPEAGDPLAEFPPDRVEAVRRQLARDFYREPTPGELATWCRWCASSGAWEPDGRLPTNPTLEDE